MQSGIILPMKTWILEATADLKLLPIRIPQRGIMTPRKSHSGLRVSRQPITTSRRTPFHIHPVRYRASWDIFRPPIRESRTSSDFVFRPLFSFWHHLQVTTLCTASAACYYSHGRSRNETIRTRRVLIPFKPHLRKQWSGPWQRTARPVLLQPGPDQDKTNVKDDNSHIDHDTSQVLHDSTDTDIILEQRLCIVVLNRVLRHRR